MEGIWENNSMKWGLKMGKNTTKIDFIYVGGFQSGKFEGLGICKYSYGVHQWDR